MNCSKMSRCLVAISAGIMFIMTITSLGAEDWSGYGPSSIPPNTEAGVRVESNVIYYKNIVVRGNPSGGWYQALAWSLEVDGRRIDTRFGPHYFVDRDYSVNKKILKRKLRPNDESNGLILDVLIQVADNEPFSYISFLTQQQ